MYFPGDPLLPLDPIFNSVPDEKARQRLIADFDIELTQPEWGPRLPLGHRAARPQRDSVRDRETRRTRIRTDSFADRRPVLRYAAAVARRPVRGARGHLRGDHDHRAALRRRREHHPGRADRDLAGRPDGRFAHPDDPRGPSPAGYQSFRGFGRCPTAPDGSYRIVTLKPGPLPTPDGSIEAPHLDVSVFARGLLDRVVTRMYFPGELAANAATRCCNQSTIRADGPH